MGAQTNSIELSVNNASLLINRFSVKFKVVAIVCVNKDDRTLVQQVRCRHEILQEPDIGQGSAYDGS
eukprot:8578011-Heterocapsa_arctica.AAC.1